MKRSRMACAALMTAALLVAGCGANEEKLLSQARTRLEQKDIEGARVQLKELLQKSPNSGPARLMLGQLMADQGEAANAEAELRRALELRQPEEAVLPLLAASLVNQGKGGLVISQYGNLDLKDDKASAALKAQVGIALLQEGRGPEGEAALAAALQRDPEQLTARVVTARVKAAKGDVPGALADIDALLAKQPGAAQALTLQGDLLSSQNKPAEAIKSYRASLKSQATQVGVHTSLMTLLLAQKDTEGAAAQLAEMKKALPRNPQTAFFEAVVAQTKGEYAKTRDLTQQLLRGAPDNPRVLMLAGEAEFKLNNLAQADVHFSRVVQLAPKLAVARRMLAQVQLREGLPDKALATLAPLLESKPVDADAQTLAGQAQLMTGNRQGAEANFSKAAESRPDDNRLKAVKALTKLGKGDDKAAFGELETLAAADSAGRVDLALISAKLRNNDLDGALKAIDKLAAKLPNDAVPDQLRGRVAAQRGDLAGARKYFEAALTKNPSYMPSLAALAILDVSENKLAASKARFEAVIKREPTNASAMMALGELSARDGQPAEAQKWLEQAVKAQPNNAMARLVQIDMLLGQRETAKALSAAQAGTAALPNNGELLDRLARAQLASGEAQQAVATYGKLATMLPKSPVPQLRLADAQTAAGNRAGASVAVKRAQELAPDALPVLQAVVMQSLAEGKPEQALAAARRMQAVAPQQATGFQTEGDVALTIKQYDVAMAAFRKAIKLSPNTSELATRLHVTLVNSGKTAEAEAYVAEWMKAHPDDPVFQVHLGDQAMARKDLADAEQRYRKVLDKHPDSVLALNNLAYLLASSGKPGGMAFADRAVKLAPNQPALLDTLALAQATEKELAKAVATQTQAVSLAPGLPQFRLQLAKFQLQNGDKAAARDELRKLAKLGSGFPRQDEVSAMLKDLGG